MLWLCFELADEQNKEDFLDVPTTLSRHYKRRRNKEVMNCCHNI